MAGDRKRFDLSGGSSTVRRERSENVASQKPPQLLLGVQRKAASCVGLLAGHEHQAMHESGRLGGAGEPASAAALENEAELIPDGEEATRGALPEVIVVKAHRCSCPIEEALRTEAIREFVEHGESDCAAS